MDAFHRCRLDQAGLTGAQREILAEFLGHNINNAVGWLVAEMELRIGFPFAGEGGREQAVEEALARIQWTLDQVAVSRQPSAVSQDMEASDHGR